jgi:hypothetical protein
VRFTNIFFTPTLAVTVAASLLAAPPQARMHGRGGRPGPARGGAIQPPAYGSSGPASIGGVGPAPVGGVGHLGPSSFPYHGYGSGHNNGFRGRGRNQRSVGWGLPFAYFMSPYYYPGWGYDSSSFNTPPVQDASTQSAAVVEDRLGEQIQKLSAEIEELKNAQQQNNQPDYPPVYIPPAPETPPAPSIVVVLRDGQQIKVDNYAVMNNTFWDFSKQPARKIPISSIDLAASQKASEANGAEFPQLSTP